MRKLLTALIMISLSTIMIDIDKSKGTDQERIVSLCPEPTKKDIAQDITIKVFFDVELDAKHVKRIDIQLEKISDKKEKIKGETTLSTDAKIVTFKTEVPLEVGYYEIKIKSLKPKKEENKRDKVSFLCNRGGSYQWLYTST